MDDRPGATLQPADLFEYLVALHERIERLERLERKEGQP